MIMKSRLLHRCYRVKQISLALFISVFSTFSCYAQSEISVIHSISDARMPLGDHGYTLDGSMMNSSSASKLLNTDNFSPTGTYPNTLTVVNGYVDSNSLASINTISDIDLFFFGSFDKNNSSLIPFTDTELDSLHKWSMNGGKMIIAGSAPSDSLADWIADLSILDSRWDFDITFHQDATIFPSAYGLNSVLFNGPFGAPPFANQGGSIKGFFNVIPNNTIVLAEDWLGNPTLILDCKTLDLIIADVDVYTTLGNVSNGGLISTGNDILWANSIVYMDMLQDQPIITQSGEILSTSLYNSYQWYQDSIPIPNANLSSYDTMGQTGVYHVEVSLDCGCDNVTSNSATILSVGINETSGVRKVVRIIDQLGREVNHKTNQILLHIYDDGSVEKKFVVE